MNLIITFMSTSNEYPFCVHTTGVTTGVTPTHNHQLTNNRKGNSRLHKPAPDVHYLWKVRRIERTVIISHVVKEALRQGTIVGLPQDALSFTCCCSTQKTLARSKLYRHLWSVCNASRIRYTWIWFDDNLSVGCLSTGVLFWLLIQRRQIHTNQNTDVGAWCNDVMI